MRELRDLAALEARARLRDWVELAPEAQETLRRAAAGELRFEGASDRVEPELIRSAVRAASEILDRALGTVKQMHEHRVQGGIVVAVAGPPQIAPELESGSGPKWTSVASGPLLAAKLLVSRSGSLLVVESTIRMLARVVEKADPAPAPSGRKAISVMIRSTPGHVNSEAAYTCW